MPRAVHARLSTIPPVTMRTLMRGQSGGPHRTLRLRNHEGEAFVPRHFTPNPDAQKYMAEVRTWRRTVGDAVKNAVEDDLQWTCAEIEACRESGLGTPGYLAEQKKCLEGRKKEQIY